MDNKQVVNMKTKILFYTIIVLIPFFIVVLVYLVFAAYKTAEIYENIKTRQRGWRGNVHAANAELGFAPVPNSEGAHIFPRGPDIPMRYDGDGFRVPMEVGVYSPPRPLILALGCSYTYGDATYAEDTYPYLVGLALNGTSKNAGVCSYGLSQMLLLARRLVPIHKPDYVLVQYSPWLVDRAQNPFAPSNSGKLPTPFFYSKDHNFALYPPVFLTKIMELPFDRYRNTPKNWIDALSFYWYVGLPLSINDDFNMLLYITYRSIGIIPNPVSSRYELIKYVYKEINDVAEMYGARTIVVLLGNGATPVEVNKQLFPPSVLLVNAQDALLKHLETINTNNYLMAYAHWRGFPPVLVDYHPNKAAHRIIADTIVSSIKQAKME